jgi:hypothetical protein
MGRATNVSTPRAPSRCSKRTNFHQVPTFKPAPFHEDCEQDVGELVTGNIKNVAWIAFRESAKTSAVKIALAWIIARQQVIDSLRAKGEDVRHWGERRYINVDSYDKSNAESILFDVVMELQTNDLLIADFGHLYNQPRTKDQATLKRISDFITINGIRVEAHTALTPMRGRLYQQHRPDFVLRDDLENAITAESPAITEKIIRLLDEAKGGMAPHGASLTVGNFIIETGSWATSANPSSEGEGVYASSPSSTKAEPSPGLRSS